MLTNKKLLGAVGLVVIVIAAVLLLRPAEPCCAQAAVQAIAPQAYVSEFVSAPTSHLLIDVRTPEEFASGHIAGAVNIPVDALSGRLSEIPNDQPVVVYCRSGNRSATASQILHSAGYPTVYDLGGIIAWSGAGLPVE
jgi:rhodanese-related sulfurtransferase